MYFTKHLVLKLLLLYLNFSGYLQSKPLVCYHTNWSQYRPGMGKFFPQDIDPFLCTHIIYAFAKIELDHLEPFEWNDLSTDWAKGMYEKTIDLKQINRNLKVLIAVGGWNAGPGPFSTMVRNQAYRSNFVRTSVDFLLKNKFDGLDIDWEYPASREGSNPEDKQLFTVLLKELHQAFAPHNLMLTVAVGVGESTAENGYEISKITQYVDFINLMTYDLHGAWDPFLGHHTAFQARKDENEFQSKLNVKWVVDYWLQKGAQASKIMLGLALYGRSFTLSQPGQISLGQPAKGPSTAGTYTRTEGIFSYYEICEKLKSPAWTLAFDQEQKVSYCYSNSEWIGFDTTYSLQQKLQLLNQKGLGGAMLWALDFDDFNGNFCNQGKYPLVSFIKSQLNGGAPVPQPVTPESTTAAASTTASSNTASQPPSTQSPNEFTPATGSTAAKYCNKGDGYFTKPGTKCKEFYMCVYSGTPYAGVYFHECPQGFMFDPAIKGCMFEAVVTCEDLATTTTTPAPTTSAATAATTANSPQDAVCSIDGYFVKKGTQCREFYVCFYSGTPYAMRLNMTCPDNLIYDIAIKACNYPNLVTCQEDSIESPPSQEGPTTSKPAAATSASSPSSTKPTTVATVGKTNTTTAAATKPSSTSASAANIQNQPDNVDDNPAFVCSKGNGYFVKPKTDCKEYFYCAFVGTKYQRVYNYKCDADMRFNVESRKCDYSNTCVSTK